MSREAYTPPSLSSTNNNQQRSPASASAGSSSTPNPSSANEKPNVQPPIPNFQKDPDFIDYSADERQGRPKNYNAADLLYKETSLGPVETVWSCVNCETLHRFGPGDYLRCKECAQKEPGRCFLKVKDYRKMDIDDRTWFAR